MFNRIDKAQITATLVAGFSATVLYGGFFVYAMTTVLHAGH